MPHPQTPREDHRLRGRERLRFVRNHLAPEGGRAGTGSDQRSEGRGDAMTDERGKEENCTCSSVAVVTAVTRPARPSTNFLLCVLLNPTPNSDKR